MAMRRLSGDCEDNAWTCPGVWEDGEDSEDVTVVGILLDPSPVPLGEGEAAIRIPRRLIAEARIG